MNTVGGAYVLHTYTYRPNHTHVSVNKYHKGRILYPSTFVFVLHIGSKCMDIRRTLRMYK